MYFYLRYKIYKDYKLVHILMPSFIKSCFKFFKNKNVHVTVTDLKVIETVTVTNLAVTYLIVVVTDLK